MAPTKKPVKVVFIIFCTSATILMTSWCIYKYLLDRDVTIVTYKRLHESIDDIYPSISLCFYQPYVENHFQRYGIHSVVNSTSYINFLKGDFWSKEFIGIDYNNVTLNFKDYFLSYDIFENFDRPRKYTFDEKQIENGWKPPHNTYSSPMMKCFTVDVPFQQNKTILAIAINIKTDIFPDGLRPNVPNQFMVVFAYPKQGYRSKNFAKSVWPNGIKIHQKVMSWRLMQSLLKQ